MATFRFGASPEPLVWAALRPLSSRWKASPGRHGIGIRKQRNRTGTEGLWPLFAATPIFADRDGFPAISPKTIARIERKETGKLHGRTLDILARVLEALPEEIETFLICFHAGAYAGATPSRTSSDIVRSGMARRRKQHVRWPRNTIGLHGHANSIDAVDRRLSDDLLGGADRHGAAVLQEHEPAEHPAARFRSWKTATTARPSARFSAVSRSRIDNWFAKSR